MSMSTDEELLRRYGTDRDEAAFEELVSRYTNLVYSVCLRRVRSHEVARDLAQTVFADLARKAPVLWRQVGKHGSLAGWLHRGTNFAAAKYLRDDHRRQVREKQGMEETIMCSAPDS